MTPWTAARQASLSLTISPSLSNFMSIESVIPSSYLILCRPLLLSSIFPSIRVFFSESAFLHWVAKELELQLQHQSFWKVFWVDFLQDWLVWSPCFPRDSQESSLVPRFESINCLALCLLYCLTLTSIHDYWKSHSFDYTDLGKVMSLLFSTLSRFVIVFLPRSSQSSNFMVAVTTCIDFRDQVEFCYCFPLFPFYLPWSDGTVYDDLINFFNIEF